ncbi:MAG: response regulator transcription factor [Patescibacteria group bacterium]
MAKILIIEDDEFLRGLLAKKLSEDGHEVEQAETGERGVELIPEYKPGLILLDLLLPSMHGFEVLTWLREKSGDTSDTPVIILSNLGNEDDIEKGYELGANDFLVKAKFTPQEITEKVRKFTEG